MANVGDDEALERLAGRDSATVPVGTLLVAEVDGEIRAAWSAHERRAIADPFHPTADLVELLRAHSDAGSGRRRGTFRLARRAPWPA